MIGGFFGIDLRLLQKEPQKMDFLLRCDTECQYNRKFYTNNGRTATVYALQELPHFTKDDIILVPDYLCVSVLNALETSGASFRYYRIKRDLTIDLDDLQEKMDEHVRILYVIHYFGIPQPAEVAETIAAFKTRFQTVVIEDLTQTLYTRRGGRIGFGDLLVASTRKWIPVTDGGLLAVRDGVPFSSPPLADAYDKAAYRQLLISLFRCYYETHPEEDITPYLMMEKEANAARYIDFTPKEMTELSSRIFFSFDHEAAMRKRRENYQHLMDALSGIDGVEILANPLDTEGDFIPFGFPILVEDRDGCYQYLADHGIIGEIQWILPKHYYCPGESAQYLSDHNIMLQCDQRYGRREMQRAADCLKKYFGGAK